MGKKLKVINKTIKTDKELCIFCLNSVETNGEKKNILLVFLDSYILGDETMSAEIWTILNKTNTNDLLLEYHKEIDISGSHPMDQDGELYTSTLDYVYEYIKKK